MKNISFFDSVLLSCACACVGLCACASLSVRGEDALIRMIVYLHFLIDFFY